VIAATVRRWSAWSPGLEDADAWARWCAAPTELASEGRPEARFLPALLRRRCGSLSRILLTAAFECCEEAELTEVATVFASRHGNINESIDLLDRLAERQPLSPTVFSHTVHNAQAGLFSIAAANRRASSSIAAQQDSFACGYLEALTLLERDPDRPVLLVVGDVPLAPTFAPLVEEPAGSYGLGLLLARGGEGTELGFGRQAEAGESESADWPDAIEFLRWYLSDEPSLVLGSARRPWKWERLQ
jgi:Beta-ketoacyl synthase, N-terminal domain